MRLGGRHMKGARKKKIFIAAILVCFTLLFVLEHISGRAGNGLRTFALMVALAFGLWKCFYPEYFFMYFRLRRFEKEEPAELPFDLGYFGSRLLGGIIVLIVLLSRIW